ncbi:predicted protein [Chaetoceros tenuissimus]|uniref:Uncharacterized protein n=1 Tax=Chaetoceros tenuissimus TaxID=426638 RepID=A0AAD3DC24_9STRA|nr:predicted protein [Chaetoceros tenuissimus]
MDNTNNSTKRKKHYMSPFQMAKEHKSSRTQEQEHLFVQDQLHLSPTIVLSPLLTLPPPLDPVMTIQGRRDSQEYTTARFTWEPPTIELAGEPLIVREQQNRINYNSPPSKRIVTGCSNQSTNESSISSKDFFHYNNINQGPSYAPQQLLNLHQKKITTNLSPRVPEVSEFDWSTSSQLNTSVANNNKTFVSQEAAKEAAFFDSSYLDQPILNNRKKSSFSDINQFGTTNACGFLKPASSPNQKGGSSIDNKNLFKPIPLTRTTVRENHMFCLPAIEKDNLSDEEVKLFLHKMTTEQKFMVYEELNDEFCKMMCNSHYQKGEELRNFLASTKFNFAATKNQKEECALLMPLLDYDLQGMFEKNNNITTHENNTIDKDANNKTFVKECSFRRGTESLEGRSYFKSLSSLAFEAKLNWIVQTIETVSRKINVGYVEKDRTFLLRIWNVYKCFTSHCNCDWKVFASKYGKVSHTKFQCTCQETVDSDDK